uniref:neuroblastoma breakpoint family member 6 isoform X2 n=1 Tax=Macaca mulatta TaxID=9544 RepID=UPI0010A20E54|nr:neuroblastoma breakpoint family member 6 isoform X2 [Macaca mulatta]
MVVSADPLSSERAEMNILEINKELRTQLAESNQQFRDLKEKFLITQATAYSLANQLKKYKCEEYKDIIDSVLRDELQFVEKLAEKLRQAEELGQYKALVHSQARELTQLREKLQEGRDASRSLNQHFKALLAPDDLEKSQGQDLREQLAKGRRLAEHLVHKLSPENDEDEDEDEKDAEVEKVQESPAPREVQKAEGKEVPQNSLEECAVTCSNSHNPSNSNQPHRSTKITFEKNKVDSALVVESERFHDEEEEALTILPVPGSTSSATNVSMVVSADPLSGERAEMNILEINKELRSQLAESNQQFRDLKEKFLITQATAYSLANQLKKYKCEEYKDIIDSVLRDELQFVEKLAEKLRQAEELGQYKALVHSQARELTQLREKLQEGRDASRSLNQHFKALLTPDDLDKFQGQDLREQLAEGRRLAEHLLHKLSPETDEDEDEDEKDAEVEKVQESPAPREVQMAEGKEVPQDSLEECAVTCSNSHDPSDSNQPHRSTKITSEEDKVDSALVVENEPSHDEEKEALNILPENQNDHEEEQGKAPVPPRHCDMSNSYLHHEVTFLALDEEKVCSVQDVARDYSKSKWDETPLGFLEKQNNLEEVKGKGTVDPRLSRGPLRGDKREVPQESLDGCCFTPSILPDLPHSYRPYGSTSYCFEEMQVSLALVDKIEKDQEELEDQDPPCPRLSQELPEVKEQEIPEDSVDEVYLTPSVHRDLSDCHQPYSSTLSSLEDQLACSALDIASPTKMACPQGTWSADLSHHLSEVQVAHAQLEPSTLVPSCLRLQLDQGNGLARRSLSSTTCSFTANTDSGNQWNFQELVLEPSLGMKNPPQLGGDALKGSAENTQGRQVIGQIHASSVLKPKIIKRKLPLSKWRLACRFPGLQA